MMDDQTEVPNKEAQTPTLAPHKPKARKKPDAKEKFAEDVSKLADRAKADGVNTLSVMFGLLASQARATIDGYLGAIEGGDDKKKRKKKK